MSEFFAMSGYGQYLWPSFAVVIGIVVLNVVLARRALSAAMAAARRRMESQS
jgi:heme exporter protein CcmD